MLSFLGVVIFSYYSSNLSAQSLPPYIANRLNFVLDSLVTHTRNPKYIAGISAAIRSEKWGNWKGASGKVRSTRNERLTPEHLFRIYSSTKTYTAALILQLMAENRLRLNDPIYKYIRLNNPLLDSTATISQLLNHSTGFSDYTNEMSFVVQVLANPARRWQPWELIQYAKPWFKPGEKKQYSSTNYIILGLVAQKVMQDTTCEVAFRKRFFDRLGLQATFFPLREVTSGPMAMPHDNLAAFGLTPDSLVDISEIFPFEGIVSAAWTTGGLVATAEDLAKWGQFLYSGRAISKIALDTMLSSLDPNWDDDTPGYGVFNSNEVWQGTIGHGGASVGYRSLIVWDPINKISIAVMTNQGKADLNAVARALLREVQPLVTSTVDSKKSYFYLFPNPCSHTIWVRHSGFIGDNITINIYNKLGQQVWQKQYAAASEQHEEAISLPRLANGVYYVHIKASESEYKQKLLIMQQ
ncbi:MAG: serine hydrolase [Bacteroidia bacterium]|nr:serine hydrolase [Bacteroidia bacterium]MDW8158378.1 serine hydrolase [Bacteroidia bacterium]